MSWGLLAQGNAQVVHAALLSNISKVVQTSYAALSSQARSFSHRLICETNSMTGCVLPGRDSERLDAWKDQGCMGGQSMLLAPGSVR